MAEKRLMEMPSQDWIVKTVRGPLLPQNHGRYITSNSVDEDWKANQCSSRPCGK